MLDIGALSDGIGLELVRATTTTLERGVRFPQRVFLLFRLGNFGEITNRQRKFVNVGGAGIIAVAGPAAKTVPIIEQDNGLGVAAESLRIAGQVLGRREMRDVAAEFVTVAVHRLPQLDEDNVRCRRLLAEFQIAAIDGLADGAAHDDRGGVGDEFSPLDVLHRLD